MQHGCTCVLYNNKQRANNGKIEENPLLAIP